MALATFVESSAWAGLAFLPVENPVRGADSQLFAETEREEFQRNDWRRAAEGYQRMAAHRDVHVRAGALVRLARVQAKAGARVVARIAAADPPSTAGLRRE